MYITARPLMHYDDPTGYSNSSFEVCLEQVDPNRSGNLVYGAHLHCEMSADDTEWVDYSPTSHITFEINTGYSPRMVKENFVRIPDTAPQDYLDAVLKRCEGQLARAIRGTVMKKGDKYCDQANHVMCQVFHDREEGLYTDARAHIEVLWAETYKTAGGKESVCLHGSNPCAFPKTGQAMTQDEAIKEILGDIRQRSEAVIKVFLEQYCTYKR